MGDLLRSVDADWRWLLLGVLLHLGNQVARGCGWRVVLRGTCRCEPVRTRDVLAAWVAGAGGGGVLSARGGDALRLLLLHRRTHDTGYPVLAGTLVAEAAGEAVIGVALVALAIAAGLWPGLGDAQPPEPLVLGAAALVAAALAVAGWRSATVRRLAAGLACGASALGSPGRYARTVMPWQLLSRVARAAAIACFLVAFAQPATPAAILVVMLAQAGGRLLPLAPASVGGGVAILAAGFGPVTGADVGAGRLAAFFVGTSAVLTVVGVALAAVIVLRWGYAVPGIRVPRLWRSRRSASAS
jgi:uncharacterized membrane protein YbhN (UPF0104 family)